MAKKKATGSVRNGRDSNSKSLGIKKFGSNKVKEGSILIRQRGTKIFPGKNTGIGKDFTIYSLIKGNVFFNKKKGRKYINILY